MVEAFWRDISLLDGIVDMVIYRKLLCDKGELAGFKEVTE